MSTKTLPARPYRLEERFIGDGKDTLIMSVSSWDRKPLTRESGMWLLDFSRRQYPGRYHTEDGRPALYRLVLLGPDRTVLPADPVPATERPAEAGELCTCGRQAVKVYLGSEWGPTGYCGMPDGGQRGPCPWCDSLVGHQTYRCPNYTLRAPR